MKPRLLASGLICCLAAAAPALAQSSDRTGLELLMERIDAVPAVVQADLALAAARASLLQIEAGLRPQVQGSSSGSYERETLGASATVSVRQVIMPVGSLASSLDRTRNTVAQAERAAAAARRQAAIDLAGGWIDLWSADRNVAAANRMLELAEADLTASRRRIETGSGTAAQEFAVLIERDRARSDRDAARGNLEIALLRLEQLAGSEIPQPALPLITRLPEFELDDLLAGAALTDPVQNALAALANSRSSLAAADWLALPNVSLSAAYGNPQSRLGMSAALRDLSVGFTGSLSTGESVQPAAFTAAISLSIDIWDGGAADAARVAAEADLERAELAAAEALRTAEISVRQAGNDYQAARRSAEIAAITVERTRQQAADTRAREAAGLVTPLDTARAEAEFNRAEDALLLARARALISAARLLNSAGLDPSMALELLVSGGIR